MESEGQGKRAPAPVPVEITRGDVIACFEFAILCSRLRQYANSGGWRGGLVPAMTLYGGVAVDKTVAGIVIGKVAEVAMCRLAGVPVDLALRDRGDGGRDLLLPCGITQVKASRKAYPTKLVREPFESADWFVFATWCGTSSSVAIDGYVSRAAMSRMVVAPAVAPSARGRWMNREVPVCELLPIRSLLKIRPIDEVL
jgi:hypothetical protein